MGKSKVTRVSAEGILLAIEYMAGSVIAKGGKDFEVNIEIIDGRFTTDNLAGAIFSLVHPWVALHSKGNVCDNDLDKHEIEYEHMIEIVTKALDGRSKMEGTGDLG